MTELSLNPATTAFSGSAFEASQDKWKRPLLASLQSFFFTGLGQLYNRRLGKAVLFSLIGPTVDIVGGQLGAFHVFNGLALMVAFSAVWKLVVVADAFVDARRQISKAFLPPLSRMKIGTVLVLVLSPAILYGVYTDFFFNRIAKARAYKIPSTSNCPTACEGERMIADPSAYVNNAPRRGELVMFKHSDFDALLFKRVVAIGGDVVNQTPESILVNGKPAALVDFSQICGDPPRPKRTHFPMESRTLIVPPSSLYVVGDNWSNSLDSRMEEFGFVSIEELRGRPLFLYWSPYRNRIGCRLR